jgi:Na+-driven multidrug efflux pump
MQHTRLTLRNYSGFSMVILALGLIMAGFGAIDLMMIAPKGLGYVAAAGQGDVLVAAVYAIYLGVVDVFASRLAIAEGGSATARRLPVLFAALVLLLVPCQLLGVLVAQGTGPALSLFHQNPHLIPLVGDYVGVRVYAVIPVLLYAAVNEGLKICGMKNFSVLALGFGFAMNVVLDWVFLYTGAAGAFASPTQAVSTATVAAQTLMAVFGGLVLARQLRTRRERMARPGRAEVLTEFASMARTAVGVGVRHLNDYAGTVIPLLFIGTMGVQVTAAAVIATKIYTLFCRVPQACFGGTFAYYGYALSKQDTDLPTTVRRLNRYAAVPTAVAAVASLATATWLVEAFAGNGLHIGLARTLFFAYLLYLPVYFCEQQFGEMLTVHQRGTLLLTASTATTYILTIPVAGWAVFALHSAFWAIACKGLGSAVLAALFWRTLRRHHWARISGILAAAPQGASHA